MLLPENLYILSVEKAETICEDSTITAVSERKIMLTAVNSRLKKELEMRGTKRAMAKTKYSEKKKSKT